MLKDQKSIIIAILLIAITLFTECSKKKPTEPTPLAGAPDLLNPANNSWVWNINDTTTFIWNPVSGATKYNIIVSNSSNLSLPILNIETNSNIYNFIDTLGKGITYWQVRAGNSSNEWLSSAIYSYEKGPYVVGYYWGSGPYGDGYNSTLVNNYIYFPMAGLNYYDVSNLNFPCYVGQWYPPLPIYRDIVYKYHQNHNYLFCIGWESYYEGVTSINIDDPVNPVYVGRMQNSNGSYCDHKSIVIKDTIVYIVNYSKGVFSVNVSNPSNMLQIANIPTCNHGQMATILGNYLYIARGSEGLGIIDISNPSSPIYINSINYSHPIDNIATDGTFLYTVAMKLSVANPTEPIILATNEYFEAQARMGFYNKYIITSYRVYYASNDTLKIVGVIKQNIAHCVMRDNYCFGFVPDGKAYTIKAAP